jgi:hypothetical protein
MESIISPTNKQVDESKNKPIEETKTSYPNLSEEGRKNLINLIDKLEKTNNALLNNSYKTQTEDEKYRKLIRDKICHSLVYNIFKLILVIWNRRNKRISRLEEDENS